MSIVCLQCHNLTFLQCQINTALDLIKNELQGNSSSLTMAIIDAGCPLVTEGIIHLCNYLDMPLVCVLEYYNSTYIHNLKSIESLQLCP